MILPFASLTIPLALLAVSFFIFFYLNSFKNTLWIASLWRLFFCPLGHTPYSWNRA